MESDSQGPGEIGVQTPAEVFQTSEVSMPVPTDMNTMTTETLHANPMRRDAHDDRGLPQVCEDGDLRKLRSSSRLREASPKTLKSSVQRKSQSARNDSVSPSRSSGSCRRKSRSTSNHHRAPNESGSNKSSNSNLTIWNYLIMEVQNASTDTLMGEEKTAHLINVVTIPIYLERVILFGMLTCLDSFLHAFTVLPLRVGYAIYKLLSGAGLSSSRRTDILKGFILCSTFAALLHLDTSRIYHSIRGQAAIKLYVMFNVLEIADKLCSALGQDIIECFLTMSALDQHKRTLAFTALTLIYSYIHSLVLLYQVVSLNVAVNSYSNALITLLLSNQFSEIKGTVFKKFGRENLFQLTCADITERFQLLVMLLVVGIRNVVEVSDIGIIPTSWAGWNRWLGALFGPAIVVVGSEVMVDWLKHAYIAKFNNLGARVYQKFLDVLTIDYAENAFSDQRVTRRTGLPVYALAAVSAKMILQSYYILRELSEAAGYDQASALNGTLTTHKQAATPSTANVVDKIDRLFPSDSSVTIMPWVFSIFHVMFVLLSLFLVTLSLKLVLGILLLKYSSKRRAILKSVKNKPHSKSGEAGDYIPDRSGSSGIIKLEDSTRKDLYEPEESAPEVVSVTSPDMSVGELFSITRFKMVAKRIW